MNTTISPSRTYVAMCNVRGFTGYKFLKFTLPLMWNNNSEQAMQYYLSRLDSCGVIDGCIAFEDYLDLDNANLVAEKPLPEKNADKIVFGIVHALGGSAWTELENGGRVYDIVWRNLTKDEQLESSSVHYIKRRVSFVELENPDTVPAFIQSFIKSYFEWKQKAKTP